MRCAAIGATSAASPVASSTVGSSGAAASLPNTFSIVYTILPKSTLPKASFATVLASPLDPSGIGAPPEPFMVKENLPVMSGGVKPSAASSAFAPLMEIAADSEAP